MLPEENEEYFDGFAWAVPVAFADALGACCFDLGSVLYDTKEAYSATWGQAVRHISYSIQIKPPPIQMNRRSEEKEGSAKQRNEKSAFAKNWKRKVNFELTDYKRNSRKVLGATQGRLYTLLQTGNLEVIDQSKTSDPPIPTLATGIRKYLPKTVDRIKTTVFAGEMSGAIYLMPYDRSAQLFRTKFKTVRNVFSERGYKVKEAIVTPEGAGLRVETEFAPTVRIACFCVADKPMSAIREAIKKALYKRTKSKRSGKEYFRVSTHGHLESL